MKNILDLLFKYQVEEDVYKSLQRLIEKTLINCSKNSRSLSAPLVWLSYVNFCNIQKQWTIINFDIKMLSREGQDHRPSI